MAGIGASSGSTLGTVGIVRPTTRSGGFEDLLRMLPRGIAVKHTCLSVQRGTRDEFMTVIRDYEDKVAELAAAGADVVNPSGAPPFMVLGYDGEQKLIRDWQAKYQVLVFTSGSSHVDALRALGAKRFVGTSYFRGDLNRTYARYFIDAGFDVLDMVGMDVDFDKVPELTSRQVYDFVRGAYLANRGAEAIYMLGPAWRASDMIETLERDCGVPVVHALPAQFWDIQRHLRVRIPASGFGRLAAEMP
jgi:maleate cis-trans isomerase